LHDHFNAEKNKLDEILQSLKGYLSERSVIQMDSKTLSNQDFFEIIFTEQMNPNQKAFIRECCIALALQGATMWFLTNCMFGGHSLTLIVFACIIAHWLVTIIAGIRRYTNPSKIDIILAGGGFIIYLVVLFLGFLIGSGYYQAFAK
jgi:hypothetical protein